MHTQSAISTNERQASNTRPAVLGATGRLLSAYNERGCIRQPLLQYNFMVSKNNTPAYWRGLMMLALPIFPASRPASIVGADELNFCVRDGNRWTLIAINTNYFGWVFSHHLC